MQNHSEWFQLFSRYWWLLIVLVVLFLGLFKSWLRHLRANRGLDLIKSYIDQGKEPPPELLQYLRAPVEDSRRRIKGASDAFFAAIVVAGVAAAFTLTASIEHEAHIYFVVIILAGVAVACVVRGLMRQSEDRRNLP